MNQEVIMKNSEYNETEIQERAKRLPFDNVLYLILLAFISEFCIVVIFNCFCVPIFRTSEE